MSAVPRFVHGSFTPSCLQPSFLFLISISRPAHSTPLCFSFFLSHFAVAENAHRRSQINSILFVLGCLLSVYKPVSRPSTKPPPVLSASLSWMMQPEIKRRGWGGSNLTVKPQPGQSRCRWVERQAMGKEQSDGKKGVEETMRAHSSQMEFLTYAAGMSGMQDSLIWPRERVERTDESGKTKKRRRSGDIGKSGTAKEPGDSTLAGFVNIKIQSHFSWREWHAMEQISNSVSILTLWQS